MLPTTYVDGSNVIGPTVSALADAAIVEPRTASPKTSPASRKMRRSVPPLSERACPARMARRLCGCRMWNS
jgi:hypothetical protein